jgi:transposase
LIADKAYDADPLINRLTEREITPVIPPKCNRTTKRDCDFTLFCERNLIERFSTKKAGEPLADDARSVRELFSL